MATAKKAKQPNVSAEELLDYYREMLLIRRFEEKAGQLYGMGLIGGFCHLYTGEEAVALGAIGLAGPLYTKNALSSSGELNLLMWSDEFPAPVLENFEKASGIKARYVIDKEGNMRVVFSLDMTSDQRVEDVEYLLKQ